MSIEVALENRPLVYQGLLDDKVTEYPWRGVHMDANHLRLLLRRAALYERPMLINDGSLLHHEWMRRELLNPAGLLQGLMGLGQCIIFCRDTQLEEMPLSMAPRVESFQRLVNSPDWGSLKARLKQLRRSSNFRWARWPPFKNQEGFEFLARTIIGAAPAALSLDNVSQKQLDFVVSDFLTQRERGPDIGARSQWESAVATWTRPRDPGRFALMQLGNEMYHYNMAMSVSVASTAAIHVSTGFSRRFASLLSERGHPPHPVSIPNRLLHLSDQAFLKVIGSDPVLEAKTRYLDAVELNENDGAIELAAQRYSEALTRAFRPLACRTWLKGSLTTATLGFTLFAAGFEHASIKIALAAGWSLNVLGLAAVFAGQASLAHAVCAFRANRLSTQFKQGLASALRVGTMIPVTGTMRIDARQANRHVSLMAVAPGNAQRAGLTATPSAALLTWALDAAGR